MNNTPFSKRSQMNKVYNSLLNDIIEGRYDINEPLSETFLSKKYNCSRSPIREALVALEHDGLVNKIPKQGWFISEITSKDIYHIYEIRKLLERYALSVSINKIPDDCIKNVKSKLESLSEDDPHDKFYESDRELHNLIIDYADNEYLHSMLNIINHQIERLRILSGKRPDRLLQSRKEHLQIVNAIERRDLQTADTLLSQHFDTMCKGVLKLIKYSKLI